MTMHLPATRAVLLALCAGTLAVAQQPPARPAAPAMRAVQAPNAAINGRVVSAATGAPLRGVQVRVRADGRDHRLATTDDQGNYEVRDLLPGRWTVTASKSGFITRQFGQRRAFDSGEVITLADRQRFTADLALARAGAITGRLYDEYGEPIAGARVQVLRSKYSGGQRQVTPAGVGDLTDDTGAFRLYGLPAGEYYVGANLRTAPAEDLVVTATTGPTTYYPGTVSLVEAQRIVLGAGDEQSNVTFQVAPVRAVRVSGLVLNAAGAPEPNASVNLLGTTDFTTAGMPAGNFGMTQANGRFTVVNVPPGNYLAQVLIHRQGGMMDMEQAVVPVTVDSQDVTDLTITTRRSGEVSITVAAEGGSALPASLPMGIQLRGMPPTRFSMGGTVDVGSRKEPLRLPAMPGRVMVDVESLPERWMVRGIDVNGTDITDGPIDFGGQPVTARIVLTDRVTEVRGRVMKDDEPVANAQVVIFPDDGSRWQYRSRYVAQARAGADGTFRIARLPPDTRYLAVAVDYLEDEEHWDPEFLERMREKAVRLPIGDGERTTVSLPLIER